MSAPEIFDFIFFIWTSILRLVDWDNVANNRHERYHRWGLRISGRDLSLRDDVATSVSRWPNCLPVISGYVHGGRRLLYRHSTFWLACFLACFTQFGQVDTNKCAHTKDAEMRRLTRRCDLYIPCENSTVRRNMYDIVIGLTIRHTSTESGVYLFSQYSVHYHVGGKT